MRATAHRRRAIPPTAARRGFVLLVVLWTTVAVAALGLAATLAVREAVSTARNRVSLARASWSAEGCLAAARAEADVALATSGEAGTAWLALDSALAEAPLLRNSGCEVTARAAGAALNVNAADEGELGKLFTAAGMTGDLRDSLVDALLDWRDADDVARPRGAERAWYVEAGRLPPRGGPFADVREIALVRGLSAVPGLDSLLGTEPGRVPLGRAPLAVLAALPGFTEEAVARVAEMRRAGIGSGDLSAISGLLSSAARDTLNAHYPELTRRVTGDPDAWIVTCRMASGEPAVRATVEARLVRAGTRATLVRLRSWP
jgi:general secretion pathway protein K